MGAEVKTIEKLWQEMPDFLAKRIDDCEELIEGLKAAENLLFGEQFDEFASVVSDLEESVNNIHRRIIALNMFVEIRDADKRGQ